METLIIPLEDEILPLAAASAGARAGAHAQAVVRAVSKGHRPGLARACKASPGTR